MDSRPNLVLFIADQWRGDVVGHMGNPAAVTPNLDRMVQTDAVSFRNAFCQNPVSTPSRCSFMSGWYPHVHGHRTMTHMLRPHEPMLLKTLKDAGYYVFWDGRNDTVPAQNGFEPFCNEVYQPLTLSGLRKLSHGAPGSKPNYSFYIGRQEKEPGQAYPPGPDWGWVMGAIEFLQRLPTDRPFCLYLSVVFPHPPYGVEEPWYSQIDRKQLPPRIPSPDWSNKPSMLKGIASLQGLQDWSEERWNELRATYYGMCARIDHQLGLVMDALRRSGHYDDTAVFVFSDHGDYTGDYGIVEKNQNTFEDCLTRVPFVIKPPASVPVKPRICNALVELIDMPA
ncbi:MAG: sulfatase-like hydrolase/transferase, partial [Chloroflexota bacterium]